MPDLKDPALILAGAGNRDAVCTGCRLQPGSNDSKMHRGLYPQPPVLAKPAQTIAPERVFWVVKNGIKASGMPARGKCMVDHSLWGAVAFLQVLPELMPEDYHEAVEHNGGHSHGEGQGMPHDDHGVAEHHHDDKAIDLPASRRITTATVMSDPGDMIACPPKQVADGKACYGPQF